MVPFFGCERDMRSFAELEKAAPWGAFYEELEDHEQRDNKLRNKLPRPPLRYFQTIQDLLRPWRRPGAAVPAQREASVEVLNLFSPRRAYPERGRVDAWTDHTMLVVGFQPKGARLCCSESLLELLDE
mmetsp:Transcript_7654/g.23653  ORF Transcript_7654/g.23653 Transcript_7654/m.23653 type:complete len:128 (-) Transcript_7654:64-447(-)